MFFLPWILSNEEDGQICFALKPFQGNGAVYLENIQKLDRPASQALIRIMMTMMPRQLVNRRLLLLIMIRLIRMMMMPRQVEGSSRGTKEQTLKIVVQVASLSPPLLAPTPFNGVVRRMMRMTRTVMVSVPFDGG